MKNSAIHILLITIERFPKTHKPCAGRALQRALEYVYQPARAE
jgi:hypothetical protein